MEHRVSKQISFQISGFIVPLGFISWLRCRPVFNWAWHDFPPGGFARVTPGVEIVEVAALTTAEVSGVEMADNTMRS